jgi:small subunit ribosomal protein S14
VGVAGSWFPVSSKNRNDTNQKPETRNEKLKEMAKISKVVKNEKRKERVALWAERRKAAKKIINNPKSSPEEVDAAVVVLQKMPRDGSPIRVRNRCSQSGRTRGYLRKFGVSRIALRDLALQGQIPGVVKSSW